MFLGLKRVKKIKDFLPQCSPLEGHAKTEVYCQ